MQIVADRRAPFLVSHHGTIYEQDLGVDTDSITEDTVTFNADASRSSHPPFEVGPSPNMMIVNMIV